VNGVSELDPGNATDVDHVARLYEQFLPTSPVVRLGPRFLREFFFTRLVRDDLLGALVCRIEGRVVAFVSWTDHPADFIGRGIKRHFLALSWIMLRSIASRPVFVRDLVATLRMVSKRSGDGGEAPAPATIEAISLVVPPEFQRHVPPGGTARLTVRLVRELATAARARGVRRVLYVVQPSNTASCIFFSGMGCDFEKRTYAGEAVYVYTHELSETSA